MPEDSLLFGKPPPWSKDRCGYGYGFNYGRSHGDGYCEMTYGYREGFGDGWVDSEGQPVETVWNIKEHT